MNVREKKINKDKKEMVKSRKLNGENINKNGFEMTFTLFTYIKYL